MHRRAVAAAVLVATAIPATYAGIAGAQGATASQTISMKEFRFSLPSNLKAGRTRISFRNTGQFPHNFTVVSTISGRKFKSATLDGGKRQRRTITLRPGAYVAVCTVNNGFHLSQGMEKTFTVGKFDQATRTWVAE
jgi:plastocyanin